tara:strand:+ start:2392 stop:3084 length:693 start_codon:yes stop_codon:yes gene_type:complete
MSLLAPEISGTYSSWDSMLIPQVSADMELSQNRDAWAEVVLSNVSDHESTESGARIITIDLTADESFVEISTRLRLLFLFINRAEFSNSATVAPSFTQDTYPAMLALVKALESAGMGEDWSPDGARSIRIGKTKHLFVSVDMPIKDRSPSPDKFLEIIQSHQIDVSWYDQCVYPRASAPGLTTVMFGVPDNSDPQYSTSIFKRERLRNLSGRPGGTHFFSQQRCSVSAAV